MFFHFRALLYSLIYLGVIEFIEIREQYIFFILPALVLLSIIASRRISGKWNLSIIPVILAISSSSLIYLIDNLWSRQIFILISFSFFYFLMLGNYRLGVYLKDQTARALIASGLVAGLFLFFSSVYGFYLNFDVPIWWLMISYLIVSVLASFQYLKLIETKRKAIVWLYSFLLGLIMAEIAWVINFWPFGYLTTGVISLIFYYILWDLVQSYFLNLLSKKRVLANVILFSLLTGLILVSSRWLPAV
jgi:hypothetical protein